VVDFGDVLDLDVVDFVDFGDVLDLEVLDFVDVDFGDVVDFGVVERFVDLISRFSDAELDRMKRDDLVDVVRFAGLGGATSQSGAHLEFIDDQRLRRLACVARLACQRAVHSAYVEHGCVSPFIGCVALA